jgi:hypothetical protein
MLGIVDMASAVHHTFGSSALHHFRSIQTRSLSLATLACTAVKGLRNRRSIVDAIF